MHPQSDWQGAFARALLHPEVATPPGLLDPYRGRTFKRFAIYRNNVVAGLTEALRMSFPVVCRIVGEEFFHAMARAYVVKHPPQSPVLLEYGESFAPFIDSFAPAALLPYLGDMARIERAWLEAYHAPEATPLDSSMLDAIPTEQLPGARFYLHPSVRWVRSRFPAFTIWSTNIEGGTPIAVDLEGGGESVLVSRQGAEVEARPLSDRGLEFIRAIAAGSTVGEAVDLAVPSLDRDFDLSAMLGGMIEAGIFVAHRNDCAAITDHQRGRSNG